MRLETIFTARETEEKIESLTEKMLKDVAIFSPTRRSLPCGTKLVSAVREEKNRVEDHVGLFSEKDLLGYHHHQRQHDAFICPSSSSTLLRSFLASHVTVITPALPAHLRHITHEEIVKKFSRQFPVLRYAVQRGLPVVPVDHPKSFAKSKLLKELLLPQLPSRWLRPPWCFPSSIACQKSAPTTTKGSKEKEKQGGEHKKTEKGGITASSGLSLREQFDVSVVVSFRYFLPRRLLQALPHPVLNVHPSLLPRYRGASPIFSTLIKRHLEEEIEEKEGQEKGKKQDCANLSNNNSPQSSTEGMPMGNHLPFDCITSAVKRRAGAGGVTIIELSADQPVMDGGRIVWQRKIPLDKQWTDLRTYFPLVAQLGAAGCCELIFGSSKAHESLTVRKKEIIMMDSTNNERSTSTHNSGTAPSSCSDGTPIKTSSVGYIPYTEEESTHALDINGKSTTTIPFTTILRSPPSVLHLTPRPPHVHDTMTKYTDSIQNRREDEGMAGTPIVLHAANSTSPWCSSSSSVHGEETRQDSPKDGEDSFPSVMAAQPPVPFTSITPEVIERAFAYYVNLWRYHAQGAHHTHTWVHEVHTALHELLPHPFPLSSFSTLANKHNHTIDQCKEGENITKEKERRKPSVMLPPYFSWHFLYPQAVCSSYCDWPTSLHVAMRAAVPQVYPTFTHFTEDPFHAPLLPKDAALIFFDQLTGKEAFSMWSAFVGGAGMFSTVQTTLQKPYCPGGVEDVLRRIRRLVRVVVSKHSTKIENSKKNQIYIKKGEEKEQSEAVSVLLSEKEVQEEGVEACFLEKRTEVTPSQVVGVHRAVGVKREEDPLLREAILLLRAHASRCSSSTAHSQLSVQEKNLPSSLSEVFEAVMKEEGKKGGGSGGGGVFQTCSFTDAVHPDLVPKPVMEELAFVERVGMLLAEGKHDGLHRHAVFPSLCTSSSFIWKEEKAHLTSESTLEVTPTPSSLSSASPVLSSSASPPVVTFYFGGWYGSVGVRPTEGRALPLHPLPILQREQQRWAEGYENAWEATRVYAISSSSSLSSFASALGFSNFCGAPHYGKGKEQSAQEQPKGKEMVPEGDDITSFAAEDVKIGEKKKKMDTSSVDIQGKRHHESASSSMWNHEKYPYLFCTVHDFIQQVIHAQTVKQKDVCLKYLPSYSSSTALLSTWLVPGSVYFPHGDSSLGAIKCREGWFFWRAAHFAGAPTSAQPANLLRKGLAMRCGTVYTHVFSSFTHGYGSPSSISGK